MSKKDGRSRIVLLGPDQPGGVTTLIDTYLHSVLNEHYSLQFIRTTGTGSRFRRLLVGVAAMGRVVQAGLSRPRPLFHIHSASGMSFRRKSILLVLVRLLGCPAIVHLHSGAFVDWASGGGERRMKRVRAVLGLADSVVVLSPLWQTAMADVLHVTDTVVIPNPVRIPEAPPSPVGQDLVLYTGRLIPLKRVGDLVEAAGILQERGHRLEFVLAGVGSELESLREQASRLPSPELVKTPGWLSWEELESLLERSTIFCLPSSAEGQPLSLLEAMAAGLACVATNVGGIPSLITHKANGLLVEPGHPEEIADAIEFLCTHPDERLRMGEAAKEYVTRNFGIDTTLGALEALYSRAGYPPAG